MSGSINSVNAQGISFQFDKVAQMAANAAKGTNVIRFIGGSDADTVHDVFVTESDKVGKLGRSTSAREANNVTREIFRQSVAAMFGSEDRIPPEVKNAMKLGDYGKGKPLTARRIIAVKAAVENALKNFPVEPPRVNAPKAEVRQFGAPGAGGILSTQDLKLKGFTAGEMKMLNDVAEMYKKATGCSTADAQKAALDPKSDARRVFSYGGTFTASKDNFKKGLALVNEFNAWYDGQSQNSTIMTKQARLSVEKFMFEEIACNPKLTLDMSPADLFSEEKNLVVRFIKDNNMESICGSMTGISPEKRSVVFALADALREKTPGGRKFPYCEALMSRTLSHFGKATELVYSGNLSRQTAIDTLFPDFKSIGVNANMSNEDIKDKVYEYISFAAEAEAAADVPDDDYALQRAINRQGIRCEDMFNMSGASMKDCRRAAQSGTRLPWAPGMTDVTAGLDSASGFDDAGKNQFIGDVHRPMPPLDPKTKAPLISDENNVFRFKIGGQEFTARTCDDKNNDQNANIAKEVEKFCNREIRPVQTNAVFFALSQGGIMPQMSLANRGYLAADHGPITYTLSRNADTGDITVKYENPVGSPLKFSWTATIDVNGKTTATPIKIEK